MPFPDSQGGLELGGGHAIGRARGSRALLAESRSANSQTQPASPRPKPSYAWIFIYLFILKLFVHFKSFTPLI